MHGFAGAQLKDADDCPLEILSCKAFSVWSKRFKFTGDFATHHKPWKSLAGQGDVGIAFGIFKVDVVFGRVLLDEFVFEEQCFNFVVYDNPVDASNMQEQLPCFGWLIDA